MRYKDFFKTAMGVEPYPYQLRLAEEAWPQCMEIPTGLGKTAAVVLAWLYKRHMAQNPVPKRLVYCLPMRVLVKQTSDNIRAWRKKLSEVMGEENTPTVHQLMGGALDEDWERAPEHPAILVGTQDMLLSRAMNRGYAMSRYRWPMHFGLLHNDAQWVFDEVQLMDVGLKTSAQLQGLREKLGVLKPSYSLWMSATLHAQHLRTIDHPRPKDGWSQHELQTKDKRKNTVKTRLHATKAIERCEELEVPATKKNKLAYPKNLAEKVLALHQEGSLTLLIVNRVERAQAVFNELQRQQTKREDAPEKIALLHSRFRPKDREKAEGILLSEGDRIVVATQVVEAGVDVSAQTMLTELAPWLSLVQRFGRCNRYGEQNNARIFWIDVAEKMKVGDLLPYHPQELNEARQLLEQLGDNASPAELKKVSYKPQLLGGHLLRKKDLLNLFDTSTDLSGADIDISPYIRSQQDTDVQVFWRDFTGKPLQTTPAATSDEICAVPVGQFRSFLTKNKQKKHVIAWVWEPLARDWTQESNPKPGQRILLSCQAGGYDTTIGWNGSNKEPIPSLLPPEHNLTLEEAMDDDPQTTASGRWTTLQAHLSHVTERTLSLAHALGLGVAWEQTLAEAARWHDVGKAHEAFQHMMLAPQEEDPDLAPPKEHELWAKAGHDKGRAQRPRFRHELASALAWLQSPETIKHNTLTNTPFTESAWVDLVAFLIATHHGKVRLSLRALPEEQVPPDPTQLFSHGVWDGDELPTVRLPDGRELPPLKLDLSLMQLGAGSWLERMLGLRDDTTLGPFRLAYPEAILRVGDWRASADERTPDQAEQSPAHARPSPHAETEKKPIPPAAKAPPSSPRGGTNIQAPPDTPDTRPPKTSKKKKRKKANTQQLSLFSLLGEANDDE